MTPFQHGFRKNRSTETALLAQKEFILGNFEERRLVLALFIDFKKAFDSLNHKILLAKLESYGIRGRAAELVNSYLSHRRQYVNVNGHSSETLGLTSGVPQGSILGPFLFNLYINDIVNIHNSFYVIYADDTSVFFSGENPDELIRKANEMLAALEGWSKLNALEINAAKTKAIIFRPKGKTVSFCESLTYSSKNIEIVAAFKTLGVWFTEKLLWDVHVNHVCLAVSRFVGLLYRNNCVLPTNIKLLLFKSLFMSQVNYCQLVWGTSTHTSLKKLYVLQKKALRIIYNLARDHPSAQLFQAADIPTVFNTYNLRLVLRYKYEIKNNIPMLADLAELAEYSSSYPLRLMRKYETRTPRTNYGAQMLRTTLPSVLNLLSQNDFDIYCCKSALHAFLVR